MRCPKCGSQDDKVIDSRSSGDGVQIRRRRECLQCNTRFTTYEEIHRENLRIQKRNGQYEAFNRSKLIAGLQKACEKRPISSEQIEALADNVLSELEGEFGRDLPSQKLGELVMKRLRKLDAVAYVRFVSVYRQFDDVDQFITEIKRLGKT
jgi:transcriptional repressor NrdR